MFGLKLGEIKSTFTREVTIFSFSIHHWKVQFYIGIHKSIFLTKPKHWLAVSDVAESEGSNQSFPHYKEQAVRGERDQKVDC